MALYLSANNYSNVLKQDSTVTSTQQRAAMQSQISKIANLVKFDALTHAINKGLPRVI
jgi:hypothetical protein